MRYGKPCLRSDSYGPNAMLTRLVRSYVRAFEVGQNPTSVGYDLAVKLKSLKGGPVVRNRIRLPHPVGSDTRIGVVCRRTASSRPRRGRSAPWQLGEESLFEQIRAGNIPFNKLICHESSEAALKKAALGKILGPKGLMPNLKTRTITKDVLEMMREIAGASDYKERNAVVRLAIGQLGFTPEMVSDNIKAFMSLLRSDVAGIEGRFAKTVDEVVLSATHSPGFSLNGAFASTDEKRPATAPGDGDVENEPC